MRSVGKNLLYNLSYQILVVIVPLVTSPYLARTLGAEIIGIYSYTYSVVFYFMIFAVLGINNYGSRYIAKVRDNEDDTNRIFCSIYLIQLILSSCVMIVYSLYCIFVVKQHTEIVWIQGLNIISNLMDVTWYFYGKENFKLPVLRNGVVKLLSLILILVLVKDPDDVWIYSLIMAGSMVFGQLLTWPKILKDVTFVRISRQEMLVHVKPICILFVPVLAISIFSYMDKVMLGQISGMTETGFFENSEKIISIPKALIQAVGTVMLPRTVNMLANGKNDEIKKYIKITMIGVLFVAAAFAFGLAGVAPVFAPVFWGADFVKCGTIIAYMTPALVFSVFGNVIRTQYLIPKELDKEYTISLVLGAITNFILNLMLIESLGSIGATIGTIGAEFVLCAYQVWAVRKELEITAYLKNGIPFFLIGLSMFFVVRVVGNHMRVDLITLIVQIFTGGLVYLVLS